MRRGVLNVVQVVCGLVQIPAHGTTTRELSVTAFSFLCRVKGCSPCGIVSLRHGTVSSRVVALTAVQSGHAVGWASASVAHAAAIDVEVVHTNPLVVVFVGALGAYTQSGAHPPPAAECPAAGHHGPVPAFAFDVAGEVKHGL